MWSELIADSPSTESLYVYPFASDPAVLTVRYRKYAVEARVYKFRGGHASYETYVYI